MRTRLLGRTGLEVSLHRLGTKMLGPAGGGAAAGATAGPIVFGAVAGANITKGAAKAGPKLGGAIGSAADGHAGAAPKARRHRHRPLSTAGFVPDRRTRTLIEEQLWPPHPLPRSPTAPSAPGAQPPGRCRAPHVPHSRRTGSDGSSDQRGRSPPERFVGQGPGHGVRWPVFEAAAPSPLLRFENPTREDRTVGAETLTDHDETELVDSAELGQVRSGRACVASRRGLPDGALSTGV